MKQAELINYLDTFLQVKDFKDYAPNGLQVEGKNEVNKIVTGVTACQALIEKAIAVNADAILVHHGFFWKNEPEIIVGMKQRRIKALLANDINLLAYHLPIDGHVTLGNNALLGKALGLVDIKIVTSVKQNLLWQGQLTNPLSATQMSQLINNQIGQSPLHIDGGKPLIKQVAWCTGGAQDYIDIAAQLGVDAFISGEVSERTFHSAVEQQIHYFAAGHHATERFGIRALGEHLAEKFNIKHEFIDIHNPV